MEGLTPCFIPSCTVVDVCSQLELWIKPTETVGTTEPSYFTMFPSHCASMPWCIVYCMGSVLLGGGGTSGPWKSKESLVENSSFAKAHSYPALRNQLSAWFKLSEWCWSDAGWASVPRMPWITWKRKEEERQGSRLRRQKVHWENEFLCASVLFFFFVGAQVFFNLKWQFLSQTRLVGGI